ncbi:MAG: phosphoglycerate dehydrogenase [Oligoflexia bacterium]|nr:phosphoglycerate dehydrogenase [Oligoflexia bacterium]
MKVLISAYPFAEVSDASIKLLKEHDCEVILNTSGKKYNFDELASKITNVDAVICGTELFDRKLLSRAKNLKLLSRVGIGLDNVDFDCTREMGIIVAYTPDAPSLSVAELTIGHMLSLLRYIDKSNNEIKSALWKRHIGHLLCDKTIGIVGVGRIGKLVIKILQSFHPTIIANDIFPDEPFAKEYNFQFVSKEELLKKADVVTIHIPLYDKTYNFISSKEIDLMPADSIIINTSRGNIVDEEALLRALESKKLAGAGLDVFSEEPYNVKMDSKLAQMSNVVMTAHMGSCTRTGRYLMEYGAAEAVIDIKYGRKLKNIAHPLKY